MNQEEHHHHHHINSQQLLKAFIATLAFMLIEFIGGIYTNSIALTSDAFHMLTDATALGLSLMASYLTLKKKSLRAEKLTSIINALFLALLAIFILFEAFDRLKNPVEIKPLEAGFIGFLGLIFNMIVLKFLSHAHADNLNVKSAMFHVLGDLLGSIGVIIATVLYSFGFQSADPIVSIFVSLLILTSSVVLINKSTRTPTH